MHQTLTGTKKKQKKQNPSIYSRFWTPHAYQCFVRLCFVFFVFLCLPMFFEHHYKTKCKKMRLGFRAIRCRKHRYLQCFVFIFIQKLRPWSPALKKNGSQLLLFWVGWSKFMHNMFPCTSPGFIWNNRPSFRINSSRSMMLWPGTGIGPLASIGLVNYLRLRSTGGLKHRKNIGT